MSDKGRNRSKDSVVVRKTQTIENQRAVASKAATASATKAASRSTATSSKTAATASSKAASHQAAKTDTRRDSASTQASRDTGAVAAGMLKPKRDGVFAQLGPALERLWPQFSPDIRVQVRRPADLLVFDLLLINFQLVEAHTESSGRMSRRVPPEIRRRDKDKPSYLVVELPPQSFGEQAFLDPIDSAPAEAHPGIEAGKALPFARIRMAGLSRLAFRAPSGEDGWNYDLQTVLDACRSWPLSLDALAVRHSNNPPGNLQPLPLPLDDGIAIPRLPDLELIQRDWFANLPVHPDWVQTTADFDEAIRLAAGVEAARHLQAVARTLAQATQATFGGGTTRTRAATLDKQVAELNTRAEAEVERFANTVPTLRDADGQAMVAVALGLATLGELLKLEPQIFERLPNTYFLWWLLKPHQPARHVTAMELPYRLVTTPLDPGHWRHASAPVVGASGRTELWHTRLTYSPGQKGRDAGSRIRAIWSPDYEKTEFNALVDPPKPFRMTLDALDRKLLVQLTAGFNEKTDGQHYWPLAAQSDRLSLSALGALLDAQGVWERRPDGVGLEQWKHQSTLGRDHYVRVVYAGFLMPFGHAASLIKVTERKFENLQGSDKSKRVALLRQRFFIVVREPVRSYTGQGHAHQGRGFPFTSVELLTRVTPNLLPPEQCKVTEAPSKKIYGGSIVARTCFWPKLGASNWFDFDVAATDLAGDRISFSMPMMFVGDEVNWTADDVLIGNAIAAYNLQGTFIHRHSDIKGATVCYADVGNSDGVTRLPTQNHWFKAAKLSRSQRQLPQFYPELQQATVGVAAIQKLLGKPDFVVNVEYPDVYKAAGLAGANKGELFLKLLQAAPLKFGAGGGDSKSDALGGLATPELSVLGLSRILGPASARLGNGQSIEDALKKVRDGGFDPVSFFEGAKILGGIALSDLLDVVTQLAGADVPKLLSQEFPDRIEARFDWETPIKKSDPLNLFVPRADPSKPTPLKMSGRSVTRLGPHGPDSPTSTANATLDNFKVNLFGFIIVWFDHLEFKVEPGQKPDVIVDLHRKQGSNDDPIAFGGPLEFVNDLRQFIPSNGFSDPPNLSVTPSGIQASFSLGLPSIQVGVFALSNVSLGAGFDLPFDAKPMAVRFNFCERQSPFNLTVSLLGGGGFFAIGIDAGGVREIEAALEFGASVQIDLGVASGGVEIKAGVYFHWLQPNDQAATVELTGYVRLHGELTIICLISASLTFNLELGYLKQGSKSLMFGEAELIIEVEVLLFSASVTVRCRREFGGGAADPRFIDLVPQQSLWDEYCDAFALEAA